MSEFPKKEKIELHCEHCGALLKEYWHNLTNGMVASFRRFALKVRDKGENKVHPHDEVGLSYSQQTNFSKLQYFGLIAKWVGPDGSHKTGYWVLTSLGLEWLQGRAKVSKRVKTWRGHKIADSDDLVGSNYFPDGGVWHEREFEFDIHQGQVIVDK